MQKAECAAGREKGQDQCQVHMGNQGLWIGAGTPLSPGKSSHGCVAEEGHRSTEGSWSTASYQPQPGQSDADQGCAC